MLSELDTARPSGKLLSQHYRSYRAPKIRFVIWLVVAVISFALVALTSSKPGSGGIYLLGLLIGVIASLFALVTLPRLRSDKTLELYDDGFILRRTKDSAVVKSGLWKDVQDIQLPYGAPDKLRAASGVTDGAVKGFAAGGPLGALAGILFGSAFAGLMNVEAQARQYTVTILPQGSRPMTFEAYSEQSAVASRLTFVPHDIWLPAARTALASGQEVFINHYPGITLTAQGMLLDKRLVPWANISKLLRLGQEIAIDYQMPDKNRVERIMVSLNLYRNYLLISLITDHLGK